MDYSTQDIIIAVISFLIGVIITRYVFSIPAMLANSKAQTKLLIKIAEKNGVSIDAMHSIVRDVKMRYDANGNIVNN